MGGNERHVPCAASAAVGKSFWISLLPGTREGPSFGTTGGTLAHTCFELDCWTEDVELDDGAPF